MNTYIHTYIHMRIS